MLVFNKLIPAILASLLFAACSAGAEVAPVFPGRAWKEKPPAELHLDAEELRAFSEFVGGRGCVIRKGYLAYSWGDIARRADVASACKPVFSHLLLKAIEDGRLSGVDEPVPCEILPVLVCCTCGMAIGTGGN
jgi:hypothetical protein